MSEEIQTVKDSTRKENTEKANKKADRLFVSYLATCKDVKHLQYWLYEPAELDRILCKFWFKLKMTDGEHYCVSSLKHIRYSLNRLLKEKGHSYSIIKSSQFSKSQQCFDQACSNLKQLGHGYVVPYKEIKPSGQYSHIYI